MIVPVGKRVVVKEPEGFTEGQALNGYSVEDYYYLESIKGKKGTIEASTSNVEGLDIYLVKLDGQERVVYLYRKDFELI